MSWLNGLSAALTAGTGGVASYLEGQQKGRKEADAQAREIADTLRQKRIDEQNDLYRTYQISGLKRQEADAAREPEDRAELERLLVAARGGNAEAIAKVIARRPDLADEFRAPKPTAPIEGSDEWKANQRFKASLRQSGTSNVGDRLLQSQAFSAAQSAKGAYDQMLARRPEARRPVLVDSKDGFVVDPAATADKRSAFSADSTAKAQDVQNTFAAARSVGAPVGLPTAVQTPAQVQANAAIAAINASKLSAAEKLKRINGVKAKLATLTK